MSRFVQLALGVKIRAATYDILARYVTRGSSEETALKSGLAVAVIIPVVGRVRPAGQDQIFSVAFCPQRVNINSDLSVR